MPLLMVGYLLLGSLTVSDSLSAQANTEEDNLEGVTELMDRADAAGQLRVILQLDVPFAAEGDLSSAFEKRQQQNEIADRQAEVMEQMAATSMETVAQFKHIPFMAVRVNAAEIEQLATLLEVISIEEDVPIPHALNSTIPIIGANTAWTNGYTGVGQAVAILDTGLDLDHPAFVTGGSRIVAEGCFSTTDSGYSSQSICPGGVEASTSAGSGVDCVAAAAGYSGAQSNCTHGTHVAGIAAGNDGSTFGVAKDADIIAIQIFSLFTSSAYCGSSAGCALTFTSDQILGLERVYELRFDHNIAAVNMSLGGSTPYDAPCDSDSRKAAIDNLRSVGIATVVASGNNGYKDGISKPACISSAVSVGATNDDDTVASYSNVAPTLDLFAPGTGVVAAVPNNSYGTKSGTSMAAPHVAGAWALYKQAVPHAAVDDVLAAFQSSGALIDDNRSGGVETDIPRINVDQAINQYVAGLTVDVTASKRYALPGDELTFTVTVENETAVTARTVLLTNTLPSNFTLDPDSLSGDAIVLGNQIRWLTLQTLGTGQALTRTFSGVVDPAVAGGSTLLNRVEATSLDMAEARMDMVVIQINTVADCDFTDGFESVALGTMWAIETTEDGRVSVTNALPKSGSKSMLLDDSSSGGTYSEAGAYFTANLTNLSGVTLTFDWYDLADEYDPAYDGVFAREAPDQSWVKLFDFSGNEVEQYQAASLDIIRLADDNNLSLTDQFQIKFGFYDNYPATFDNLNGGDGYLIDNVALRCVPADLTLTKNMNETSLDPGQHAIVTMVVDNHSADSSTDTAITSDIPSGLLFGGSVTLTGDSGSVAEDAGDLPTILSEADIAAGGQITLTFPLTVATGIKGGTTLTLRSTIRSDQHAPSDPYSLSVLVRNVSPTLLPDTATTAHHTPLTLYPLDNDTDGNGDTLTIVDISVPDRGGQATVDGAAIAYTPRKTFAGVESFTYTVADGAGKTAVSTITITVPNVPPVATDDETAGPLNKAVHYPVLHNDSDTNLDTLSLLSLTQPTSGSASIVNNLIVYQPETDFEGTAVIPYTVSDGKGGEANGTLRVTIAPNANGLPVAQADTPQTERDTAIEIDVLENDVDPNLDQLTLVTVTTPTFGTAVIQNNKIAFTPKSGFVGVDSFTYSVQDDKGGVVETAVFVSVALQNTEIFDVDPDATAPQTLTTADNRLTLSIPVGALSADHRQIAYTVLDDVVSRPAAQGVGINFALNVGDGSQIFTGSPTFDPALELTLRYNPATLPDGVGEGDLQLYFFNETTNRWEEIEIAARDLINNTLTVQLSHFTDFSVAAEYTIFLPTVLNN